MSWHIGVIHSLLEKIPDKSLTHIAFTEALSFRIFISTYLVFGAKACRACNGIVCMG